MKKKTVQDDKPSFPFNLDPQAFERFAGERLTAVFANDLQRIDQPLKVELLPPPAESVLQHLKTNRTLMGKLVVRWAGSDQAISFSFPYPFHGVFIFRSETSGDGRAGKWIWHPRLVGKPGIWVLKKYKISKGKQQVVDVPRIVYPNGFHYDVGSKGWLAPGKQLDNLLALKGYGQDIGGSSQELLRVLDEYVDSVWDKIREPGETLDDINKYLQETPLGEKINAVFKEVQPETIQVLDEQDIGWQRLDTFSSFLLDRILTTFIRERCQFWLKRKKSGLDAAGLSSLLWSSLCELDGENLIPFNVGRNLMGKGYFHYFDPVNGIDALSRLTSFQRYNYRPEVLERLPAGYRQNHPSYYGIVCPVESPESKKVGLTLHLARGVNTDILGRFHPSSAGQELGKGVGYGASLVPFYQHNDGPRAMMGAKNLKQGVPIKGWRSPAVKTGSEAAVAKAVEPLAAFGLVPSCSRVSPGIDLLVAYMPWYGWNMEDAIVANRRLVDEGVLDWESEEVFFKYIQPGFELVKPDFGNTFEEIFKILRFDEDNLHQRGSIISPEIPVAFFKNTSTGEKQPVLCGGDDPGELVYIRYNPPASPFLGGTLTWTVRRNLPLMVGDKLMGRYGNKGVVSKILPPEEMPCFPEDPRLPKSLRGRSVDLVLNPHGVISRMNLGQLLETQLGLLFELSPEEFRVSENIGQAFVPVDVDRCRRAFQKANCNAKEPLFDEYGRIQLILPDGKKTKAPVSAGYQHVVRLKHVAAGKAQVRGGFLPGHYQYPYNLMTGQPVGGRRRKGGQRLGEMEIWALAANQADHIIQNVLAVKSDLSSQKAGLPHGQTFQAIKDHLFCLGVELKDIGQDRVSLELIQAETIKKRGKEITDANMWDLGVESEFSCSKTTCSYKYPRKIIATGKAQRSGKLFLTLGDVLKDHGLQLLDESTGKIPALKAEAGKSGLSGEIPIRLESLSPKGKIKKSCLSYSRKLRSLHVKLTLSRFNYSAYMQVEKVTGEIPLAKVLGAFITCPKHTVARLKCTRQNHVLLPRKQGLCDHEIFGNVDVLNWQPGKGGYIKLPGSPFMDLEDKILKKHFLLKFMHEQSISADCCYLPVLPLKYRYWPPVSANGKFLSSHQDKISKIYQQLIKLGGKANQDQEIFRLVEQLSQLLSGRLFGKFGLIRRDGLGRRVDMSARLVIVPDPTLDWDSCGVPTETLITLLGPRIADQPDFLHGYMKTHAAADKLIKELFGSILSQTHVPATVEREVFDQAFWKSTVWPDKKRTEQHLRLAYEVLECYLLEHPETTVLLNRQPSLHRYSMMGFRPVPLPPEDGLVLRINPLVCKGFGADFDGDEMAVYMSVTDEEQADMEAMKPTKSRNLISVANGEPMANFDQDFVCGHFYLSMDPGFRDKLKSIFPVTSCPTCEKLLEQPHPWLKKHGETLVSHLCKDHPVRISRIMQQWMQLAFKAVTESGLSFGFLELEKIHGKLRKSLSLPPDGGGITPLKEVTDAWGDEVLAELETIIDPSNDNYLIDAPAFGLAALALSGARGRKQTRQLVGGRGLLLPGDVAFGYSPDDFFIPQSLVAGMSPKSAFMAAMNARSSMVDKKLGTGRAGHLMRSLVLALWEWTVKPGDCGQNTSGRSLQNCRWRDKKTICSACYGSLPGYDVLPANFPAGLIAAQSFGERGTQLSMQSFHTAERQLSIDDVSALLGGKDNANRGKNWFDDEDKADGFVERIKKENGYRAIDERHIRLIWLAIHLSEKKNLASVWECSRSPLAALAGPGQEQTLRECIEHDDVEDFAFPMAKIIASQAPGIV